MPVRGEQDTLQTAGECRLINKNGGILPGNASAEQALLLIDAPAVYAHQQLKINILEFKNDIKCFIIN
jgi:hypothetical protein